jgi:NADH/NAD ratio-sensing transcriptional regulator Rex
MKKISESAVRRLSLYLRLLQEADAAGADTISSGQLAERGGTTSAQVRKDLSLFGSFGKRGLGYSVPELLSRIRAILGLQKDWRVALVGAGKLGSALASYRDFEARGFHIRAVFDVDPARVGTRWGGLTILADEQMDGRPAAGVHRDGHPRRPRRGGAGGGGPAGAARGCAASSTSRPCGCGCRRRWCSRTWT